MSDTQGFFRFPDYLPSVPSLISLMLFHNLLVTFSGELLCTTGLLILLMKLCVFLVSSLELISLLVTSPYGINKIFLSFFEVLFSTSVTSCFFPIQKAIL